MRRLYERLGAYALWAALAALPFLCVYGFVHYVLRASIADHFPSNGDPCVFWHEIATLVSVGLGGGHYGYEELAAPAAKYGVGTFAAHSMWFQMIYAGIGKVVGWKPQTPVWVNIGFLTAALALLPWLMRAGARYILFCLAFFASCLYMQMFTPIMMSEAFQFSVAIALAGLFFRHIEAGGGAGAFSKALWVLIACAGATRYSWALLFFAYHMPFERMRSPKAWALAMAKALAGFALCFVAYLLFAAPYPYEPFPGSHFGMAVYASLLRGDAGPLAALVKTNFLGVFEPEQMSAQLMLFWMVIAYAFAAPLLTLKERNAPAPEGGRLAGLAMFHVVNMGSILAASFFYYYAAVGMTGLRLGMPHFVCSLLILARTVRLRWLMPVLALQLVLAPALMTDMRMVGGTEYSGVTARSGAHEFQELFSKMAYRKGAPSPWCNTALVFGSYSTGQAFMFIPPEMGINDMRFPEDKNFAGPLKSGWVLTRVPGARKILERIPGLEFVGEQGAWSLFRNAAAGCGPAGGAQ
ncbi:hypothetical protein [Fundidesulfovibrio agrisoli]|uniref:hypothetical protein n=1 Tax=Fundidesulfovibrio agrisoli TaxID=2922717 RepID=UPI001FAC125A|nr:hypothetical protein [Fundidesulfovibrio agrisoli]